MSWVTRAVVVDHDTGAEHEVGVVDATVTIDRKADCRRVVDATLTDDVDPALLQAPHRLKLWAGYRAAGVDYLAPLAHVRMGDRSRGPLGAWQVSQCLSFEALVAAAGFWEPYRIDGKTSMVAAVKALILEAVPWASVDVLTETDAQTPTGGVVFDKERWAAVAGQEESLATALGVDVGCDRDGVFIVRDLPSGSPVWDVSEGPGGLLVDWSETISSRDVVNVWVVGSDHPDVVPPARAVVLDDDPLSPTRVARWGHATDYYTSALLSTGEQAQSAGTARLAASRGERVNLDLAAVPNPWLDLPDIIASTRDGVESWHMLDKVTHSLRPDQPARITCAARTVAVVDV